MGGRDIRAFTPVFDGLCPGMMEQSAALLRNRGGNFSVERLMELLTALGQDVRITAKPTKKAVRERWTWWWGEAAPDVRGPLEALSH